jgi:hypothetical protein
VSAKRRRKACCNIPPSNVAWSVPHYLKDNSIWSECPKITCLTDIKNIGMEVWIL